MKEFFEYLRSKKIDSGADVFPVLTKLPVDELIDLAFKCYELTEFSKPQKDIHGFFSFSAGKAISGGIYPCAEVNCRLENVYELSVFAALYADRVLIPNYFEYMHDFSGSFSNKDKLLNFANTFAGDLILMFDLRPLLLEGVICINPAMQLMCESCHSERLIKEGELSKILEKVERKIGKDIAENVKFTLSEDNSIVVSAPAGFVATEALRFIVLPPQFKKYIKAAPRTFSKKESEILGLQGLLITPIFNDLILQRYSMTINNVAYLTKYQLEARIIDEVEKTKKSEISDGIILRELVHELPFVQNASIANLLKLRKKEAEAFSVYRDAVNKTVLEIKKEKEPRNLQKAVNDIILPEVRKIDRIITTHQEDLNEKLTAKVISNGMILTGGLLANKFLGMDAAQAIALLGGVVTVKDALTEKLSATSIPIEAKRSEYYFFWKLRHETEKKR